MPQDYTYLDRMETIRDLKFEIKEIKSKIKNSEDDKQICKLGKRCRALQKQLLSIYST